MLPRFPPDFVLPLYYDMRATFYFQLTDNLVQHIYLHQAGKWKARAFYQTPEGLLGLAEGRVGGNYRIQLWDRQAQPERTLVFDLQQVRLEGRASDAYQQHVRALALFDFVPAAALSRGKVSFRERYTSRYRKLRIGIARGSRQRVDFSDLRDFPLMHQHYGAALLALYDFTRHLTYLHSLEEVEREGYCLLVPPLIRPPICGMLAVTVNGRGPCDLISPRFLQR